jgi:hypothetical protein
MLKSRWSATIGCYDRNKEKERGSFDRRHAMDNFSP